MYVRTRNSVYKITPKGTYFEVLKVAEIKPNPNGIFLGWKKDCTFVSIGMSPTGAVFDTLLTSEVMEISDDMPKLPGN